MAPGKYNVEMTRQRRVTDEHGRRRWTDEVVGRYSLFPEPTTRVWRDLHGGIFGPNAAAAQLLKDRTFGRLYANRRRQINEAVGEISGNESQLRHTVKTLFENLGHEDHAERVDELLRHPETRRTLVEALNEHVVREAILVHSTEGDNKAVEKNPYLQTTWGILGTRGQVAETWEAEILRRNPGFFGGPRRPGPEEPPREPPTGDPVRDPERPPREPTPPEPEAEEHPYGESEGESREEKKEDGRHMTLNELLRRMAYKHISLRTGSPHAQAINTDEIGNTVEETFHNAGQFAAMVGWKADRKDFKTTLRRMLKIAKASASPAEMLEKLREIEAIGSNPTVLQRFNRLQSTRLVDENGREITDHQNEIHIANITSLGQKAGERDVTELGPDARKAISFWYFAHRTRDLENPAHQKAFNKALRKYAKGYEGTVKAFLRTPIAKIPKTWD